MENKFGFSAFLGDRDRGSSGMLCKKMRGPIELKLFEGSELVFGRRRGRMILKVDPVALILYSLRSREIRTDYL